MSSSSEEDFKSDSCRSFLVTYSQADLEKFPTRESFVDVVKKSFETVKSSRVITEWACCKEPHANTTGFHYHMALNLSGSRRWLPLRNHIQKEHGIAVNFATKHVGYVAAYRYVCKGKSIDDVLHSDNHTNLMTTPKTAKAMNVLSNTTRSEKRKSLTFPSASSSSSATCSTNKRPRARMNKEKVSAFLLSENIKTEEALYLFAKQRKERGEPDIYNFLVNTSANVISQLVSITWKIENVERVIQRKSKTRLNVLHEILQSGSCDDECGGTWHDCALEVLRNNHVSVYLFAAALRQALEKGRQKNVNILIVGPTNCGKSFLLNPLEVVYKSFVNPACTKYCWIGLDECEIAFLNDFRWSSEMITWSDLLLLLEGQTVNLPRPKNQFSCDLTIDRENTIPFFATSKTDIEYVGRYNARDERETDMMSSRWMTFRFTRSVENPKHIKPCGNCFAKMVMTGFEGEN